MTPPQKIELFKEKPLLLYSALDWGLGHTTRSIPLIKRLLEQGARVIVACNSTQKKIFQAELSGVTYVDLFGYDIKYGRSRPRTILKLMLQIPKILIRIKSENRWLNEFLCENRVDGVISDNRYGLNNDKIPCVLMTHQLRIISGFGDGVDSIIQKLLYRYINRFTEGWVPDNKENGLAGKLSHPNRLPAIPVKYIGLLSRMKLYENVEIKYKYCFILSGPEPQRSIFEKSIIDHLPERSIIIRGLPTDQSPLKINATVINYADAELLNTIVCESETIVCRPGYTSMMELISLKKKIIVIPTPGQTEQEYLAKYLSAHNFVQTISSLPFL